MGGGGSRESATNITRSQFFSAVKNCGFDEPQEWQWQAFSRHIRQHQIINSKREAAMFLAQIIHESGGLQEKVEENEYRKENFLDPTSDFPGKFYYGRGYLRLCWCENYRDVSWDLGLKEDLVLHPDEVALNDDLSWRTALSYWKLRVQPEPGVKEGKFGATTRILGKGLECRGNSLNARTSQLRFEYYKAVFQAFEIPGEPDGGGCKY